MVNFECVIILPRCKIPHVLKSTLFVLITFNAVYKIFLFKKLRKSVLKSIPPTFTGD